LSYCITYAPQPPLFGRVGMSSCLLWMIAGAPFIVASVVLTVLAMSFVGALVFTIYDVWRN
jgi:hypothetical protein